MSEQLTPAAVATALVLLQESFEETLATLADADLLQQIRDGEADVAGEDVVSLDDLRRRIARDACRPQAPPQRVRST